MNEPTKILVIDDLETNLFMLAILLKREGLSVLTASSGTEGRRIARELRPDLILLDIVMPEENGFQTCELLKRDRRTASIPIIFLSALEDTESKMRGLRLGAVDFVSKPFMREEVLARIRPHLRLAKQEALLVRSLVQAATDPGAGEEESGTDRGFPWGELAAVPYRGDGFAVSSSLRLAEDISSLFFATPSGEVEEAQGRATVLQTLFSLTSTILCTPESSLRLMNSAFCELLPGTVSFPVGCCLYNRHSSRLSLVAGGSLWVFIADKLDVVESFEILGENFGGDPEALFSTLDRTVKQDLRIIISAGAGKIEEQDLRRAVVATLSLPLGDQVAELPRALLPDLLPLVGGVWGFST